MSIRFNDPQSPTLFNCFTCKEQGKLWQMVHSAGTWGGNTDLVLMGLKLEESDEPSLSTRLDYVAKDFDQWILGDDEKKILRPMSEAVLSSFKPAACHPRVTSYATRRRVTDDMLRFWGMKYHPATDRLVFIVRNGKNELVGGVGRAIEDSDPKKYHNFFGFETGMMLGGYNKATGQPKWGVVEGFHDVLNVWAWGQKYGYDIVCTFGSKISEVQADLLTREDKSIHFLYDQDKAGDTGWQSASKMLKGEYGLKRITWENKDLDMGDVTTENQFASIISGLG